ncbi:hypothetical protein [Oceanobacillus sp. CAU 1775]
MVISVLTLGAVFTAVVLIINLVLLKVSSKSNACYYASIFFSLSGLLLLGIASVLPKVDLLGAGLGGWGIAGLFAGAIGFMVTSIVDAYVNTVEEA